MKVIKLNSDGFTLMELVIIGPILMATIAILMNFMFNQYGQLLVQNTAVNMQVQAGNILASIKPEAANAASFVSQINSGQSDDFAPNGGWVANNKSNVLILSTSALTSPYGTANSQKVYINTAGCEPEANRLSNDPLLVNIVYFSEGSNLYRRVLSNKGNASTCGNNYFKQTCPSANSSSDCPEDKLLTNQLDEFKVSYIDQNGNETSRPEEGSLIKISLKLKDKAYAETVVAGSNITIRRAGL